MISTFLFGFENVCFKYYFSCVFTILLSSWPFLPTFRENVYIRLFGTIGCLLFFTLNCATFGYTIQHYLNGYLPFSESNFILQTSALYFYDILSMEVFADGGSTGVNTPKISPGEEHIAKLTKVLVSTQKGKWLVGVVSGLVSGAYAFQQIFYNVPIPRPGSPF